MSKSYSVVIVNCFLTSGMGIVCESTHFCSSETDFLSEMFVSTGKKRGVQNTGSIGFSTAVSTRETFGAHLCMVVTVLVALIMNRVAYCYSYRQALALSAATPCFHQSMPCLDKKKAMFQRF